MSTIVELPRISVACAVAVGGAEGVPAAIDTVEEAVHKDLAGRKCFGIITYDKGEMNYKAGITLRPGESAELLGLQEGEIPAGKYVRERIKNYDWRTDVPRIIASFEKLTKENEVDNTRPSLEYYRRHDEILVHVPIK